MMLGSVYSHITIITYEYDGECQWTVCNGSTAFKSTDKRFLLHLERNGAQPQYWEHHHFILIKVQLRAYSVAESHIWLSCDFLGILNRKCCGIGRVVVRLVGWSLKC